MDHLAQRVSFIIENCDRIVCLNTDGSVHGQLLVRCDDWILQSEAGTPCSLETVQAVEVILIWLKGNALLISYNENKCYCDECQTDLADEFDEDYDDDPDDDYDDPDDYVDDDDDEDDEY